MIRLFSAVLLLSALSASALSDSWMPESRFGPKGQSVTTFIEAAEAAFKKKEYKLAEKFYTQVEKNTINMKNRARAIAMEGVCLAEQGKSWQAFSKYEQVLDNFAGYIPFDDVLKREYDLAEAFNGAKESKFGVFSFSTDDHAEEIYDHVVKTAPYSDLAPQALYKSALISMRLENYEGAIEKLRRVRSKYQRSEIVPEARLALADALLRAAANADGDGSLVREANRELDRFVERYPDHPEMARAAALRKQSREQDASRLVALGKFYLRPAHERRAAARTYLQEVTANYPETPAAAEAERLLAEMAAAPADDSPAAAPAMPQPAPEASSAAASSISAAVSAGPTVAAVVASAPAPAVAKPAAVAAAPAKAAVTQPAETTEDAPLQSGEGRFLRPVENLDSFR